MPEENLFKIKEDFFELKLLVNGDEVASSKDVGLWQEVFAAINRQQSRLTGRKSETPIVEEIITEKSERESEDKAIASFAETLGISTDELQGACTPSKEVPYIHLDEQYWEVLKAQTPPRGRGSISPATLSATLLVLWFKYAGLGRPSPADVGGVERTINLEDKARMRSIKNCSWLQIRNGKIAINPAEMSKALELAKAYCIKESL